MSLPAASLLALLRRTDALPWATHALPPAGTAAAAGAGWLQATDSLTQRLRERFGAVTVELLAEGERAATDGFLGSPDRPAAPNPPEGLPDATVPPLPVWERCVCLHAGGQPRIAARTCIPQWSAAQPWRAVARLGRQPLGELLFTRPGIERGRLTYAVASATPWLPARRCRYVWQGAALDLTEVFLDAALA